MPAFRRCFGDPLAPLALIILVYGFAAQTTCPCTVLTGQVGACVAEDTPGSGTCTLVDCASSYACNSDNPTDTCTVDSTLGQVFSFSTADQTPGASCSSASVTTSVIAPSSSPGIFALGVGEPSQNCDSFCSGQGMSCNVAASSALDADALSNSYIIGTGSPSAPSSYQCFDVLATCDPALSYQYESELSQCQGSMNGYCYRSVAGYPSACSYLPFPSYSKGCACETVARRQVTFFTSLPQSKLALPPLYYPQAEHLEAIAVHVEEDLRAANTPSLKTASCSTVRTPAVGGSYAQVCCSVYGTDKVNCLPSIVVAGAQKSGSSFVHAALMQHPEVRHSTAGKELHFFDSELDKGTAPYFYRMPPTSMENASRTVTIDSSPSYILKEDVCSNIHMLLPDAVVVMVLRNPKERAHSEDQMLSRQDKDLKDFNENLQQHFEHLAGCISSLSEGSIPAVIKNGQRRREGHAKKLHEKLDACVPEALLSHSRWTSFKHNVLMPQISSGKWDKCFEGGKVSVDAEACQGLSGISQRLKANYRYNREITQRDALSELKNEAEHLRECQARNPLDCFIKSGSASDLTRHRLFRGMYALQLKQCMASIPKNRLVILENAELRADPVTNINKVLRAAGLKEFEDVDVDAAWAAFHAAYPDFEQTGWRENGEYEPMSEDMETFFDDFYKPLNEELFELLGRRFENW
eukprot:CAMPEP_0184710486 /NCGR_PEP_ID=MMETSP0314-20130426/1263_1 /TAXON_ID=38298 /ORGANISM="Rhodella maculata, Strain CCMP 736" /LENGTH=694 /DNA_ID=CAMNT_0027172323 /DNA_START=63 /DNA_END=2147 /DNA_ORIENTATION=-